MKELSKTEVMIMKCVWAARKPLTANQILEALLSRYPVSTDRRTLGTLLYRLEEKGYLTSTQNEQRINYYTPLVSENCVRKRKMSELLSWWFGNSRSALISYLDEEAEDLDTDDTNDLP